MPEPVETTDPEGVDYGRVMQLTFIITIVVGAPVVAVLSVFVTLPTWSDRAVFAVQVGALVWFVTSIIAFLYERRRARETADDDENTATGEEAETEPEEQTEDETAETAAERDGAE